MKGRKITTTQNRKPKIRREREPISWKYIVLCAFCGLMLVVGFFGAARQHFASIHYSIENSKMKKQVENLESEKVRLKLAKEIALTPSEIKKSAKQLGFTEKKAGNIQAFQAEPITSVTANTDKSSEKTAVKTVDKKVEETKKTKNKLSNSEKDRETKSDAKKQEKSKEVKSKK